MCRIHARAKRANVQHLPKETDRVRGGAAGACVTRCAGGAAGGGGVMVGGGLPLLVGVVV